MLKIIPHIKTAFFTTHSALGVHPNRDVSLERVFLPDEGRLGVSSIRLHFVPLAGLKYTSGSITI